MFPVAAIAGAGWLFLLVVLLIAPPSPGPHEGGGHGEGRAFVHARVNLRSRADVTVAPVEPPAVAHPLARVAADQERAVTNGLPDPADLVLGAEAAAILGGKVRGNHVDGAPGRTMVWQPPSTGRPMLRVEVRHAADARRVPPAARPAPGVADGYLVSQGAAVTVSALTALVSIHGARPAKAGHIAVEASLAGLLLVVEGRLCELSRRLPLLLILINIDDRLIHSSIWDHANDPLS